jgi:toxin ParE1/3/4
LSFRRTPLSDIERVRELLDINNPDAAKRALRVIFAALERVEEFPDLGRPTEDAEIRQIVIRFGAAGYVVRHTIPPGTPDVLVLRLWHGREART